ncbi:Protein dispatched 1 [Branchiostoma belcheri]|nr:Protein dispatched 1 [Branchiostoma belcheri]
MDEPQTGPSSCRAVEMDEYADSDMSEDDSHSQNAFLLTRASWQNLGLQQLDTALETEDDLVVSFPQHGRHNSMGDTGLDMYVDVARQLGTPLDGSFLFPPTTKEGEIADKRTASTIDEDEGETLHSFRVGCAITLTMTGVPKRQAMDHIRWFSEQTPAYYTKLSKVVGVGGISGSGLKGSKSSSQGVRGQK